MCGYRSGYIKKINVFLTLSLKTQSSSIKQCIINLSHSLGFIVIKQVVSSSVAISQNNFEMRFSLSNRGSSKMETSGTLEDDEDTPVLRMLAVVVCPCDDVDSMFFVLPLPILALTRMELDKGFPID